jgi:hypothetical protein
MKGNRMFKNKLLSLPLLILVAASSAFAASPIPVLSAKLVDGDGMATAAPTSILFTIASGSPSLPACPATSPANCVTGYTLVDTTTGVTIANPGGTGGAAVLASTATSYTYTPSGGLYIGTHNFSLVESGYGASSSAPLTSPAATTSVTNTLTTLNAPVFSGAVN